MVAIAPREIEAYLTRPQALHPVVLLFGPDAGLVRERADGIAAASVDDPKDPFALVRMDGDDLSSEPSRLVEEAMSIPMFGGRRAIRIRAGAKSFISGVETLLGETLKDCRVIIEAGDLRKDAALRSLCEKAKNAAAVSCYADGVKDIARLIDVEMQDAGLTIAADAREVLVGLLGGDRQASRNEIRKLALYAHGKGNVTLDDISAIITDASALAIDPMIDNAFAGRAAEFEIHFSKALAGGTTPGSIMFAAQRQAALLHKASLQVETGQSVEQAFGRAIPRWHFSREALVQAALRHLTPARLAQFMQQLGDAALDVRRRTALAETIAQRALMAIAVNARRRG